MSYSTETGRWLEADPTGATYVDGPNLYDFVKNNPVNSTDASGLFASDVHADITKTAAAGLNFKSGALNAIIKANKDTDFPWAGSTYWVDEFHAQSKGWIELVGYLMKSVKNWRQGDSESDITLSIGRALHIAQDFYSHTDWEDGRDLQPLYDFWTKQGYPPTLTKVPGAPHHGQIIPINALLAANKSFEDVNYFPGGGGYSGGLAHIGLVDVHSMHALYAADDPTGGRNRRDIMIFIGDPEIGMNNVGGIAGIPGAFNQAKTDATAQTIEMLKWFKDNIPCSVYSHFFDKSWDPAGNYGGSVIV